MKTTLQFLSLIMVIAIASCDPVELPEPEQEGIPFGLQGTIDGVSVDIHLDQPDHLMRSEADYLEEDSIWMLKGRLGPRNSDKGPAIALGFRHLLQGRNQLQDTGPLFDSVHWKFFHPNGREIERHPLEIEVQAPDSIEIQRVFSPALLNQVQNRRRAIFNLRNRKGLLLCVDYQSPEGQDGRFCSTVTPSNMAEVPVLNWEIERQIRDSAYLHAAITPSQPANSYSYRWQEHEFTEEKVFVTDSPGKIKVEAMHPGGQRFLHEKQLLKTDNRSYSTYGQHLGLRVDWCPPMPFIDRVQPGAVRITFTDREGQNWFWKPDPNDDNNLEILDHKFYRPTPLQQPVRALYIRLSCTLYNSEGDSIRLKNLTGWFAVGLPEQ